MKTINTYYVIGYYLQDTEKLYVDAKLRGDADVSKAERYSTVVSAVEKAKANGWDTNLPQFGIVKVTETETSRVPKLASKTQIDATKPVVLYNTRVKQYAAVQKYAGVQSTGRIEGSTKLEDATVFTDVADALLALQTSLIVWGRVMGPLDPATLDIIHIHQVTQAPTFEYTTEVLP